MDAEKQLKLAALFEELADAMERHRPMSVSQPILVVSGGGGDRVTGMALNMTVGGGNTGTVIGNSVNTTVGGGPENGSKKIVAELREAAAGLKAGHAPVSWLRGLVERSAAFGSTIAAGLTVAAIKTHLGL